MKSVQSEGGPLIILDPASASRWGGVMYKSFMNDVDEGANDYETLCAVLRRPEQARKGLAAVQAHDGRVLVMEMPFEATILFNDPTHACIIQAHYAEPEWSVENLDRSVLDFPNQYVQEIVGMDFSGGELLIFDSSYDFEQIQNDALPIALTRGRLSGRFSFCYPNASTLISITEILVDQ